MADTFGHSTNYRSLETKAEQGRILHPDGIQVIEDYFRTIPPDESLPDSR